MFSDNIPPNGQQEPTQSTSLGDLLASIRRNSLGLSLFATITACIIAVTQVQTRQRIADNVLATQTKALQEVMPAQLHDQSLLEQPAALPYPEQLGHTDGKVYFARHQGQVTGVVLPAITRQGYNGNISLIVGIRRDGVITGVRVLQHRETPGLGDKIERRKSNWVDSFQGRSLTNTSDQGWQVSRDGGDFDQFTGATITPRAVVSAVKTTLLYHQRHHAHLYQAVQEKVSP